MEGFKRITITLLFLLLALPEFAFAVPGEPIVTILDTRGYITNTTSLFNSIVFSPAITILLYLCVLGVIFGLIFRFSKTWVYCLFISIVIYLVQSFYDTLFADTRSFLFLVILPLFLLVLQTKIILRYIEAKKKKEEEEEAEERKHRRRPRINELEKEKEKTSTSLSGFSPAPGTMDKSSVSSSSGPVKLSRPF